MKPIQERVKEIQEKGYQLDFGTVFENTFENYKKIALYAGSMLLVFSLLFGIMIVSILISIFGIETVVENLKPGIFQPEKFTGNKLLIYTASVIAISCLVSPFQAGFLKMAESGEKDEEFNVTSIFDYYKLPYLASIIGTTFTITFLSSGLSILSRLVGFPLIGVLLQLTISIFTYFSIQFIVFGKMNALEAIKSSAIVFSKQPFLILGLMIVTGLASIVGIIGLCIGIFFTLPLLYSLSYKLYISIIETEN